MWPSRLAYKLIAVVRLRSKSNEPDLVRLYDPKTSVHLGPDLAWSAQNPSTNPDWIIGDPGHEYDLFYAGVDEISHAHAFCMEVEARLGDGVSNSGHLETQRAGSQGS
jgi:hypothetical protein